MAAEIKKELGIDSEIVRGSGGRFDVTVDEQQIWSKHDTGTFPREKDIVEMLKKVAGR